MPTTPGRSLFGRILRWILLAGVVALLAFGAIELALGPRVTVVTPQRGEVVRTIVATGRVLAPYRVDIGSQVTGTVAEIPVAEGQTVARDQVLIRLEGREAEANVQLAEAALAQAEAKLRQIADVTLPVARQNVAQTEANLVAAQAAFSRVDKLKQTGFATQAQVDDARKARDVAVAQSRAAHLQLESSLPGGTERVMAEAAVAQSEASLAAARTKLAYTVITAPAAGVLIARNVERGDVVQPGKTLMTLSPSGETQVVVQIDEKNMGLVAVGQTALVSADAYPDDRIPAELIYVNPSVDPQTATVQVKLRLPKPPPYIRQDMTTSVDIEVARKPDALVLPTTAVHDPLTRRAWVLVAEDDRAVRRPVVVGLRGDGRVEIVEGLAPEDLVIPVRAKVETGDRVRAVVGDATPGHAGAANRPDQGQGQGQSQGRGGGGGGGPGRGSGMGRGMF
ncbi:efflux RND transporter periplasmic adaptor subunit [Pinisolibacter sp.]|uniref:efflux RND transporter periplasmic adaptor subunit n=1 Tax=Pinisolibacter sp. TaxID=2172024 RepID=UPI002FDD3552